MEATALSAKATAMPRPHNRCLWYPELHYLVDYVKNAPPILMETQRPTTSPQLNDVLAIRHLGSSRHNAPSYLVHQPTRRCITRWERSEVAWSFVHPSDLDAEVRAEGATWHCACRGLETNRRTDANTLVDRARCIRTRRHVR